MCLPSNTEMFTYIYDGIIHYSIFHNFLTLLINKNNNNQSLTIYELNLRKCLCHIMKQILAKIRYVPIILYSYVT